MNNGIIKNENGEQKVGIFGRVKNWWTSKSTSQKVGTVVLTLLAGYGAYSGVTNLMDDGTTDETDDSYSENTEE